MKIKHTKVYATKTELKKLISMAKKVEKMPMWGVTMEDTDRSVTRTLKESMKVQEHCHKIALKHGLPEISGYYGLCKDGEFIAIKE